METSLEKRGFQEKNAESREVLETVGRTFLAGYAYAAEARRPDDAKDRLERIPTRFRGFAYEGAAMGFTMVDGLAPLRRDRVDTFLTGIGAPHVYMAYVGIGWGMARLPVFRWPDPSGYDPLLRWLILDGYGFHQAYFHTDRYVHGQADDHRFPWPEQRHQWYVGNSADQGIGRALWFVCGTDVERVATTIDKFPQSRHADLYAGAGLAAAYAGGAEERELRAFWDRAGQYRPQVAQGAAFAAQARVRAGLVVPHNELALQVLCDSTPEAAALVTERLRPPEPVREEAGDTPAYELWRRRVAEDFAARGRC
ncbi:DUF1702 family protein [Nocardiopsis ansamitocini]|uniref:Enediyne biosynthesis protein n=1 Tax=Nocardiopsis ansamitocini TaxID=1670832 RepID=A0A9W6UJD8_9ACTN|nr:enediyne biosynthesis protein [Nocardiopsis ansamitocini]